MPARGRGGYFLPEPGIIWGGWAYSPPTHHLAYMDSTPLPYTAPILLTETDYQAAAARFWELVGTDAHVAELVALREALRAYEQAHPAANVGGAPRRR